MSWPSHSAMTNHEEETLQIFVGNLAWTTKEEERAQLFHLIPTY
jgi:hypothetical protein